MKHYNTSITSNVDRIFNLKGESADNDIDLVANIPIIPRIDILRSAGQSTTGTINIYTTPADKDFYLIGFLASYQKDAAVDTATGNFSLTATIDGASKNLMSFSFLTLTASQQTQSSNLTIPIKIDRGTSITFTGTFGAGTMRRDVSLYGYTQETTKGM